MSVYQRIVTLMAIMAVQTLIVGLMVLHPSAWGVFMVLWWVLAGLFWWQYIKVIKGGQ